MNAELKKELTQLIELYEIKLNKDIEEYEGFENGIDLFYRLLDDFAFDINIEDEEKANAFLDENDFSRKESKHLAHMWDIEEQYVTPRVLASLLATQMNKDNFVAIIDEIDELMRHYK